MSDQKKTIEELPGSDSNPKAAGSQLKAERREPAGRRKPNVAADGPSCPFCGKRWEEHNLVRIRECMPKLEEALRLAERARIRASLK